MVRTKDAERGSAYQNQKYSSSRRTNVPDSRGRTQTRRTDQTGQNKNREYTGHTGRAAAGSAAGSRRSGTQRQNAPQRQGSRTQSTPDAARRRGTQNASQRNQTRRTPDAARTSRTQTQTLPQRQRTRSQNTPYPEYSGLHRGIRVSSDIETGRSDRSARQTARAGTQKNRGRETLTRKEPETPVKKRPGLFARKKPETRTQNIPEEAFDEVNIPAKEKDEPKAARRSRRAEPLPEKKGIRIENTQQTEDPAAAGQGNFVVLRSRKLPGGGSMSLHTVAFLIVLVTIMTGLLILYIRLQAEVTSSSQEIANQEQKLTQLKAENDAEYNEINDSISLEEIREKAIHELGMKYADRDQVVIYSDGEQDSVNQVSEPAGKK